MGPIGHCVVGFAAEPIGRRVPVGVLVFATMILDDLAIAFTYAGIEGAAQASEAARAAIAGAAIAPIVARCMDFLLLAVDLTAARHSIRSDRRFDIVSPRRAIAATLVTGGSPAPCMRGNRRLRAGHPAGRGKLELLCQNRRRPQVPGRKRSS